VAVSFIVWLDRRLVRSSDTQNSNQCDDAETCKGRSKRHNKRKVFLKSPASKHSAKDDIENSRYDASSPAPANETSGSGRDSDVVLDEPNQVLNVFFAARLACKTLRKLHGALGTKTSLARLAAADGITIAVIKALHGSKI
jgi:hypothetical protein